MAGIEKHSDNHHGGPALPSLFLLILALLPFRPCPLTMPVLYWKGKGVKILNRNERLAFEVAKDIVTARMTAISVPVNKEDGKATGEFFEEVYKKLLEILPAEND